MKQKKFFNCEIDIVIRMIRNYKWNIIVLLFFSSVLLVPIKTHAEDDFLISRIIEATYPPSVNVHKDRGYTSFSFGLEHQTENPSSSSITIPYVCSPIPFPYLRTDLRNKSLIVHHIFHLKWPVDELTIPPGYLRNRTESIYFHIEDYYAESLPLGTYEMWFDFTNCSSPPVPVVVEKLFVDVTETSITYYFDYKNESNVVSSFEETEFSSALFFTLSISVIQTYLKKNQKKQSISSSYSLLL
jgi:hypothetical protein